VVDRHGQFDARTLLREAVRLAESFREFGDGFVNRLPYLVAAVVAKSR